MRNFLYSIVALLLASIFMPAYGQNKFCFEILPGAAYVLPSELSIHQEGYPDINFKARYEVQSFKLPPYYSIRAGFKIKEDLSIEMELNHLKIYVINNPPEVQRFWATHGYNLLWFNMLKSYKSFDLRIGIGPVIAHPENIVRNQRWPETGGLLNNGYYLEGISSQIALQKHLNLTKNIFITAEAKMNYSFSRLAIVDGHADMQIIAIHGLLGMGFRL